MYILHTLPTRQKGSQNRDKVYSKKIIVIIENLYLFLNLKDMLHLEGNSN